LTDRNPHRLAPPALCVAAALAIGFGMAGMGRPAAAQARQQAEEIARGAYLVAIMDCTACHTDGTFLGQPDLERPLAGSRIGHEVPGLGVFFAPNLTPDPKTGLGNWKEEEIARAIREGIRPDGRQLAPAMPWRSYAALSDTDVRALVSYLRTLRPIEHQVPAIAGPGGLVDHPYLKVQMPTQN
jgi:mono/diheme cytochrome c family protein